MIAIQYNGYLAIYNGKKSTRAKG